ncbi:MAG: single-stranded DNA-binding protein [Chlamydiia bacterium]|nr:single-stranded DNA-binding protein [Chlamydiia bacterium]
MSNSLIIIGRLGADVESRETPSGKHLKILNIAAKTKFSRTDNTTWFRATIWEDSFKKFEKILPFLKKGTALIVSGEITKINSYISKSGMPSATTDITIHSINFAPNTGNVDQKNTNASDYEDKESSSVDVEKLANSFQIA